MCPVRRGRNEGRVPSCLLQRNGHLQLVVGVVDLPGPVFLNKKVTHVITAFHPKRPGTDISVIPGGVGRKTHACLLCPSAALVFPGLTLAKNTLLFPSPRITQVRPGWEEGREKRRVVQVILENCLRSFQCGPHTGAPYSGEGTIASRVGQGQNRVFSLGFFSVMLGTWLQGGLFVAPNYRFLGEEKSLVLSH